jgi:hypothetical protein
LNLIVNVPVPPGLTDFVTLTFNVGDCADAVLLIDKTAKKLISKTTAKILFLLYALLLFA